MAATRADLTAKRKERFLDALRSHGVVKYGAEAAGISRQTAYDWRRADEEFAQKWEDALEDGVDELERVAFERAKAGSDTLAIFLLKYNRKYKYLDHFERIEREMGELREELKRIKERAA